MQRCVVMISEIPQWRDVKNNSLSRLARFRLNASMSEIRSSRGTASPLLSFTVSHYLLHDTFVPLTVQMHLRQPHQRPIVSDNHGKTYAPSPPATSSLKTRAAPHPHFSCVTDNLEKRTQDKVSLCYSKKLFKKNKCASRINNARRTSMYYTRLELLFFHLPHHSI